MTEVRILPQPYEFKVIAFDYINYRNVKEHRIVRFQVIRYGTTEWHREPQWLMEAWDFDRKALREFAMKDMSNVVVTLDPGR